MTTVPAARQAGALYHRLARQSLRSPLTYINLLISLFFLAVYNGSFGGPGIRQLTGTDFTTFILPVTLLNASVGGAISGQLLVKDLETGYLRRLLTMPVSRAAIVAAPMLIGATLIGAQAVLVIGLGLALGASSATGAAGLATLLALAILWGLAFAGYSVAAALLSGTASGAQTAAFISFPLTFFAPTFLPRDQLQGWLQAASAANPLTYVLEAMRSLLITGWEPDRLTIGFAVVAAICLITLTWGTRVARTVTTARR